jgi:hypothetical protein
MYELLRKHDAVWLASFILLIFFCTNVGAQSYYVNNLLGNDFNSGYTPNKAWESLKKVSSVSFKPGDVIYLRRSQIWNETLIVSSSGTEEFPITYSSYGAGDNPIIKTSDTFSDWQLEVSKGGIKIWKGRYIGHKNHWSAIRDTNRVPVYFGYKTKGRKKHLSAPVYLSDMKKGFFYSPLNKDVFYFRSDEENPGPFEIGMRRYAIHVVGKSYIVLDGIDTYGPGGQAHKGSATGSAHVVVESSDHIAIKNSKHSHNHNNGIRITDGSTNCTVDKVVSNGHRSTGIYLWEAGSGNRIINSEVYSCGAVISDTGDMGLIGVWQTEGALIKGCNVHDNGHTNIDGMDAAISIVRGKSTTVIQNYVHNVGGTGIMIASDSDNSDVAYNIVQSWGSMGASFKANRHCDGIRVGSGPVESTNTNVGIFNNLILEGNACGENRAAIHITKHTATGLNVKNNIVFENGSKFYFIADNYEPFPEWSFEKNIFFNSLSGSVKLNKRVFRNDEIPSALNLFTANKRRSVNTIMIAPQLDLKNNSLLPGSIAIDNGVDNSYKEDFNGNSLPQGNAYDIGPFEYNQTGIN